jgi:hypothetical protein
MSNRTLALVSAIALGVWLRVWQYAGGASLWIDEVALAFVIVHSDLTSLLTAPLPYAQVAPPGFLLLQKLVVSSLGPSDQALRLVPLASSLLALLVFARLATSMLDHVGSTIAVLLFATAAPLVASGSLVKQYATDVCVAVMLWSLAWELISQPITRRRAAWAALSGAILAWFSQPAVLMLGALGASLLVSTLVTSRSGRPAQSMLAVVAAWGASSVVVVLASVSSVTPKTREYLLDYWGAGFPPKPYSRALATFWPWDAVIGLLGPGGQATLAYPLPTLYAVLAVGGMGILWRRKRRAAVLLTAPLVLTLCAAVARQYPFSGRSITFLVPVAFMAIATAVDGMRRLAHRYSPALASLLVLFVLAPLVYPVAATPPVYVSEHVKPVLARLQAERHADDAIYVYYGAAPAITFYASQFGLERKSYVVGGCHRGDARRYLQELDTFRGRARVWVLITHSVPPYREGDDIVAYLDSIGIREKSLVVRSRAVGRTPLPAELYLYNLSDHAKGERASSTTFALTSAAPADPTFTCESGPIALVASDFPPRHLRDSERGRHAGPSQQRDTVTSAVP